MLDVGCYKIEKNVFQIKSNIPDVDLVDFRGLTMLPKCRAALLEKVCANHPDLAICSSSRTTRWCQFAYGTLGELLFFLHSTRMREMTEDACKRLEGLWEEAQVLGFDSSWLAPSVKFGLISRSPLELQREGVLGLENEKKRLDEKKDIMRCQFSTLTMLLCRNDRPVLLLINKFSIPRLMSRPLRRLFFIGCMSKSNL